MDIDQQSPLKRTGDDLEGQPHTKKLKVDPDAIIDQKQDFLSLLQLLKTRLQGDHDLLKLIEDLQVTIAVGGNTSSGKTTLINSILKCPSLPTSHEACTSCNVKVIMQKPGFQPNKYQLVLQEPQSSWRPWSATPGHAVHSDNPIEVCGHLTTLFRNLFRHDKSPSDVTLHPPNFKKTVTLIVADPNAIKMTLIDTPGPRVGNKDTEWIEAISGTKGQSCLLLPVRYDSRDMLNGTLMTLVNNRTEPMLVNLKLIVVITHIDEFLQCWTTRPEALNDLVAACATIKSSLSGMLYKFAFVQSVDSTVTKDDYEAQRKSEMNTIDHLPAAEIMAALPGLDLVFGISNLTKLLMQLYLSSCNSLGLRAMKEKLDAEIVMKQASIQKKRTRLQPSSCSPEILGELAKSAFALQDTEDALTSEIKKTVRQYVEGLKLPEPVVSTLNTIFGATKTQYDQAREEQAKMVVTQIIAHLEGNVATILEAMLKTYQNFLSVQTNDYQERCPRLFQFIQTKWSEFVTSNFQALYHQVMDYFIVGKNAVDLKSRKTNGTIVFFETSLFPKIKDPIAELVSDAVGIILSNVSFMTMACFITRVYRSFPQFLNTTLASITEFWPAASEEELQTLGESISPLISAQGILDEILSKYSSP